MRVLALEPYDGGSHRAFLDGWMAEGGSHAWTRLSLPPWKWKWRMRHAAITFAAELRERVRAGERWDAVFCSSMLPLAEWRGLAPPEVARLPAVVYFHENQLTYPSRVDDPRDVHFALIHFAACLAADAVWFNSAFHQEEFLAALGDLLERMPDHRPSWAVEEIRVKTAVHPQGITPPAPRLGPRRPGPLRLLWAARWEYDKNPQLFFDALDRLRDRGAAFRLSVVGESFRQVPEVFAQARERFADRIDRWGYQETRADYESALAEADVIVSTADHEFFGVSVVEAVAAGCRPLLPRRLAYPEILVALPGSRREACLYDGGVDVLSRRLGELAERASRGEEIWQPEVGRRAVERFFWPRLRPELDACLSADLGER